MTLSTPLTRNVRPDRTPTDLILKTSVSPTVKVPLTRIAAASPPGATPAE